MHHNFRTMGKLPIFVFCWALNVLQFSAGVQGARILCASHQFGSHLLMMHSVVENLITRGHEVYTIYSDQMPVPKGLVEKGFKVLKYHTPAGSRVASDPEQEATTVKAALDGGDRREHGRASILFSGECSDIDNDKSLEKQLFDLKFDIAVLDVTPISSCLLFLPLKLKIPFIIETTVVDMETTRNPVLPSFYPLLGFRQSDNMSFKERLINTIASVLLSIPAISPIPGVRDLRLLEKYNNDSSVSTWNSLARKAHLHLISRGSVLEYPIPWTPNVINIECLTCKPGNPLSHDIQNLADSSLGIIAVSFGSLITQFPEEVAAKFLEVFSKRKETIFWRYKAKLPGKVPPNMKVMKWLPQNDLLAHPKTKLFITHSGNNGQYESVYHGVPMLAFPFFAEQNHNAHRITVHGYGLESHIATFTAKELEEKIDRLINEPNFRERTQHASRILKNMPMNAQEKATYWIEHVLEFGADHLRSNGLDMPWYSFYMLDVILFLQILFIAIFILVIYILSFVLRNMCSPKQDKRKKNE